MDVDTGRAARELAARRIDGIHDLDRELRRARAERCDNGVALEEAKRIEQPIAAAANALELEPRRRRVLKQLRHARPADARRRGQRLAGVQLAVGKTAQHGEAEG